MQSSTRKAVARIWLSMDDKSPMDAATLRARYAKAKAMTGLNLRSQKVLAGMEWAMDWIREIEQWSGWPVK